MQHSDLIRKLHDDEFYIDALGRIVIDDEELMREINGASGGHRMMGTNGACLNVNC